jgi:hypothetical protein
MKLELSRFSLRLKKPIQTARGPMDERQGFKHLGHRVEQAQRDHMTGRL